MRKQIDGRSSARIARSEARLQSTARDLRIFPGFSRSGKCDSRERSESERRRSVIPICESKSMEGPQPGLPEAKRGCNLRRETCNVRYRSLLRLRLRCPYLPIGSPMALRENATAVAVSSSPAKAGELSHGTFHGLRYKPGQVSNRASARHI